MAAHIPPNLPVYVYIKRVLKNQIEDGELPEGARVPSEMELARQYNVSRNPTRQALRDLELEGYIVRSPGRGSFVAPISRRQKPLRMNHWRTLAVACPVLECHYTREVVQGFIRCAAERAFHTMVYFQHLGNEEELDFLADIRNSGIEGIAFWLQHASEATLALLRKFQRAAFPFVLIDRYVRAVETDFVVTDNEDMGYQLTKALISRGHTAVGILITPLDNTSTEDRLEGHKRATTEAGLPFVPELMGIIDPDGEAASVVVSRIMAYHRRPTAFACSDDGVAVKLFDELDSLGYSVPQDVEVATVDDNQFADVLDAPVISASQSGYEMGRVSAEILIGRVEDPHRPAQGRFLKASLQPHAAAPE
jgi:DNA-binding LacI/PurR family transcriptional regulator